MDYFTQTVDSSLWASRAFDDEAYEADDAKGSLVAAPFEMMGNREALSTVSKLLVCTDGAPSVLAECALLKGEPVAKFTSESVPDVEVYVTGEVAVISFSKPFPSERSHQLSLALFRAIDAKQVVVLTTLPSWKLRPAQQEDALFYLRTSSQAADGLDQVCKGGLMLAPALLEGIGAACLSEAQLRGLAGCGVVGADNSLRISGVSIARFVPVVERLLGLQLPPDVDFGAAAGAHFNPSKGSIYM